MKFLVAPGPEDHVSPLGRQLLARLGDRELPAVLEPLISRHRAAAYRDNASHPGISRPTENVVVSSGSSPVFWHFTVARGSLVVSAHEGRDSGGGFDPIPLDVDIRFMVETSLDAWLTGLGRRADPRSREMM
jgi:hypothetical protein